MSDIFDEVTAELRRDSMNAAWDHYGRYVIGGAVGIVVAVAGFVGTDSYVRGQQEAASARYDTLLENLDEADTQAQIDGLAGFAATEDNGYGALADFSAALQLAGTGRADAAQEAFDRLSGDSRLPAALRDMAALQAAIVLLNDKGALEAIELRLEPMLAPAHGLRAAARETMALAYMAYDEPLKARELFQIQIADPTISSLTRERAGILLQSLRPVLTPMPPVVLDSEDGK